MVLQTDSVTFFLNKVVILLNYMGVFSLKFNSSTNQFEKCSKWMSNIIFVWSFFGNILYLAFMKHSFNVEISNMFVFNISGLIYIYMSVLTICCVTILNKKHENLTLSILNDLNNFQFGMEGFKYKRPLKDIVILSVMFSDITFYLTVTSINIFYDLFCSGNANNKFLYFEISFRLFTEYIVLVKLLSEGLIVQFYLVLTQFCDCFNKSFHENGGNVFIKHQCLLEVTRKLNKRFSIPFLLYIGLHFISILMWAMTVYCSIHDNKGNIFNNVEIVGLVFAFWKLVVIIIIPSETMNKVVECNFF
jgi:hypothetical protein